MDHAKFIGRIGALAVVLGVGVGMAITPPAASAESDDTPSTGASTDRTALVMGGTTIPTPDDYMMKLFENQFIRPTHPKENIKYVPLTTPQEWWPVTGFARLIGLVVAPPSIWGPGGAGWPDVPLWKLSGLFDLTIGQSLTAGVADLETEMAKHGDDPLVIFGVSQGAVVADMEKRKLAEQYPKGTAAPDIDFVLLAGGNLPNGGFLSRFPGLYIPIVDLPFNGPAPTDTQFDTVMINEQYDGLGDFPLYPINLIATLNALLGGPGCYVHCYAFDLNLPADPTQSPAYRGTYGDTSYYFFDNPDLPLFGPLRTLGVPESVIDVFEPFFRVIVELGYDRSIKPWEPTPARLIPPLNPVKLVADLVAAIGEGFNNALAIFSPPPPSVPASTPQPGVPDVPAEEHAVDPEQTIYAEHVIDSERTPSGELPMQAVDPERTIYAEHAIDSERTPSGELPMQAMDAEQTSVQANEAEQSTDVEQPTDGEQAAGQANGADRAASMTEPAKKADPPAARRPVERGTFGKFGQRSRDLLHRGDGDQPIVRAAAVGDATKTPETSKQESFSAGSPTGGDSSGGDGISGSDADSS